MKASSNVPKLSAPAEPTSTAVAIIELAERFLDDKQHAPRIAEVIGLSRTMLQGAQDYQRPAARRDKLKAVAKALRKLTQHLDALDVQTIADAMGRAAPGGYLSDEEAAALGFPAGVRVTRPVASNAPALLNRFGEMRATMALLEAGVVHLAQRQPAARRGAEETPDALMFALEGLAATWSSAKGAPPVALATKRGSFGDFAQRALSLNADVFTVAQIKTALRRLQEKQVRGL